MTLSESAPQGITVGSFVVVEADRGEDLGIVVCIAPANSALSISLNAANSSNAKGAEGELKKILRLATLQERAELPTKAKDETDILKVLHIISLWNNFTNRFVTLLTTNPYSIYYRKLTRPLTHSHKFYLLPYRSVANGLQRSIIYPYSSKTRSTNSTDIS